jgi:hypothetical protein
MTYECKYFTIQELVPEEVYLDRGVRAWQLLDERLLRLLDYLREEFGPAIVNNWNTGGVYNESGLRTPDCEYYSPYSQHTFGRACDIKFVNVKAEEVRQWLKDTWGDEGLGFSITLEENVTWVHVDVRNDDELINSFYP